MSRHTHAAALGAALVAAAVVPSAASAALPITMHARPLKIKPGSPTTVSGVLRLPSAPPGEPLELQAAYGSHAHFRDIAHTLSGKGGRFRFPPVRSSRDTRYRVIDVEAGGRAGPVIEVTVELDVYPTPERVQAAERYLAARIGETGFAVVDDRGNLAGRDEDRRFSSASMVKSMMLVAYLQMLARHHMALDSASQSLLYPMIHSSDNAAASAVLAIVGQGALEAVARQAGMRDYLRSSGWWAFTQVSAADMAEFFYRQDELIPHRFDGYARWLESTIEPSQSWGVPAVARPEFNVYFKGGWLPQEGVFNQAARLERRGISFALAVLSNGAPSMEYGEQTIAGVAERLLGRAS
jgi:hypothetical protein